MKIRYKILARLPFLIKLKDTVPAKEIGNLGEEICALYLKRKGYKIQKRNYKPYKNEIDIIAKKKNTLYFVEVKTRTEQEEESPYYTRPFFAVDEEQKNNIRRAAKVYISKEKADGYVFAVAEVYLKKVNGKRRFTKITFTESR